MITRAHGPTATAVLGRRRLVVLVVGMVFALTACNQWWLTYDGSDPRTATTVLTPEASDAYTITANTGTEFDAVALETNVGGNLRQAFWPENAPVVRDQQSCATWVSESQALNQEGAVLRQRTMADGSTQALTVMKNIWWYGTWIFNFHTWDTSQSRPFTQIGSVDLKGAVAGKPFPWHVCARAVGDRLSMKVWTGGEAEPAWGDPASGGSVTLSPEWVYPGRAGWYIGHLEAGDAVRLANLATHRYGPRDPATTTTDSTAGPSATTTEATTTTSTPAGEGEVVVSTP